MSLTMPMTRAMSTTFVLVVAVMLTLLMSNDNDIRIIDCNHDDDDCGHLSSSERGAATTPASYKTTSLSSCHRDLPPPLDQFFRRPNPAFSFQPI